MSVNKDEPDTHRYLECYCKTKSGSWTERKELGFDMCRWLNFYCPMALLNEAAY